MIIWTDELKDKIFTLKRQEQAKVNGYGRVHGHNDLKEHHESRISAIDDVLTLLGTMQSA